MHEAHARNHAGISAASLIIGPALMAIGDLFHPSESWDVAAQVTLVAAAPSHWYAAHLMLFVGMLLFVPGILAISELATLRKPRLGYIARVLLIMSVGALSAVFVFEMVLGRMLVESGDNATAVALLGVFQSGHVFATLMPGLLAFFVGTGLAVFSIASAPGPFRAPALCLAVGAGFIMAEIATAQVLLSQIGNVVLFCAGTGFAVALLRNREPGVASA